MAATQATGADEAFALTNLGIASLLEGSYRKAIGHLQQALALCRETGDPVGEAIALHNLSLIYWRQGRYQQANEASRAGRRPRYDEDRTPRPIRRPASASFTSA